MDKRYQIFISSTYADLKEERKGVMEAIIELDCFAAGMEMFPATDMEQFEYIKSIIDQSDYYILIIGGRYGSIAEDGISYTEKEFEYAQSKAIPILAFVKDDIENISASKTDQNQKKKEKLKRFRETVLKNRLAKSWSNADDLKYKVHSSLSREMKTNPRTGWVRANQFADENVLGDLVQLQKENKELRDSLEAMQSKEKEDAHRKRMYKKVEQVIKKEFEVKYINTYHYENFIISVSFTSLSNILSKTGLELMNGVSEKDFKGLIEDRIIGTDRKNDPELLISSLKEIETKMVALELINYDLIKEKIIKLTRFGLGFFYNSIQF